MSTYIQMCSAHEISTTKILKGFLLCQLYFTNWQIMLFRFFFFLFVVENWDVEHINTVIISINKTTQFSQKSASLGKRIKLRHYRKIHEAWTENKKSLYLGIAQVLFLAWQKPAKIDYKMGKKDSSTLKIIMFPL